MEEKIDELIEEIETMNTSINKINFEIDGLTEEIQELEEKRPFMVRQLQMNTRKLQKLSLTLMKHMRVKQDLDVRLSTYQVARAAESNPNIAAKPDEKTNIPETPKQ